MRLSFSVTLINLSANWYFRNMYSYYSNRCFYITIGQYYTIFGIFWWNVLFTVFTIKLNQKPCKVNNNFWSRSGSVFGPRFRGEENLDAAPWPRQNYNDAALAPQHTGIISSWILLVVMPSDGSVSGGWWYVHVVSWSVQHASRTPLNYSTHVDQTLSWLEYFIKDSWKRATKFVYHFFSFYERKPITVR
jgi:hypothetical protein